jgi:FRG domain
MNKRLTLFFRGQAQDWDPVPALFRDSWSCFGVSERVRLRDRAGFWKELPQIGQRVYEICRESELGLPRWRGLRDIRETQWSVIQHYGVWPIPLIDVTSSLRVAASSRWALSKETPTLPDTGSSSWSGCRTRPARSGSISISIFASRASRARVHRWQNLLTAKTGFSPGCFRSTP